MKIPPLKLLQENTVILFGHQLTVPAALHTNLLSRLERAQISAEAISVALSGTDKRSQEDSTLVNFQKEVITGGPRNLNILPR